MDEQTIAEITFAGELVGGLCLSFLVGTYLIIIKDLIKDLGYKGAWKVMTELDLLDFYRLNQDDRAKKYSYLEDKKIKFKQPFNNIGYNYKLEDLIYKDLNHFNSEKN